jgi:hypothetical protein
MPYSSDLTLSYEHKATLLDIVSPLKGCLVGDVALLGYDTA